MEPNRRSPTPPPFAHTTTTTTTTTTSTTTIQLEPHLLDAIIDKCFQTNPSTTHHPLTLSPHEIPTPPQPKKLKCRAPARPWSEEEHRRFEESLELFGRNWELCAEYIGTRRAQLVRSHAQKHLIKLWKLGKPLPRKVAESGKGYTLSGKPLLRDSASARSYLTKIPCPPDGMDEQGV